MFEEVHAVGQAALDAAFQAHPERFPNGPPRVPRPPIAVHINPLVRAADISPSAPPEPITHNGATHVQ